MEIFYDKFLVTLIPVRNRDIVTGKEKKQDGNKHDNVQNNKVEQRGNGQARVDNKNDGVASQGAYSNVGGNYGYHGRYTVGGDRNYRNRNGYRPQRGGQNNGYRSGNVSQIYVEKQKRDGDNTAEEEGWKYVGTPRSCRSPSSGDRRGAYGRGINNGFRGQHYRRRHRYYKRNQAETNTEDGEKTDAAPRGACEPSGEENGQDLKTKQAEEERRRKKEERMKKLKEEMEYQARLMTLKEFESMKLVKKENEGDRKSEQERLKKKDDVSLVTNFRFPKPVNHRRPYNRARNADRPFPANASNGGKPFSGGGQEDEHLNARPRNSYREFPGQHAEKAVIDTESERDFPALPGTARP